MNPLSFQVELIKVRNAVRLCVPAELAPGLGSARLLPVLLTINGHRVHTTMHKMAGSYMTAVNKAIQQQVGATAGDTVHVTIELTDGEHRIELPDDLANALTEADARGAFDQLTPFRQREMIKTVTAAKKAETRILRVEQVIGRLTTPED